MRPHRIRSAAFHRTHRSGCCFRRWGRLPPGTRAYQGIRCREPASFRAGPGTRDEIFFRSRSIRRPDNRGMAVSGAHDGSSAVLPRQLGTQDKLGHWSVDQFAQIVHHQMRAVTLELIGIPLARDTNHKSELPFEPGLDAGDGILDDDRPRRFNPEQPCRYQERVRGGFPGQLPLRDRVAIDLYIEEGLQLGGLQDGRAVLARGDDGNFEPAIAKLMDQRDASVVGLHPLLFDHLVDQVVLAVSETAHCLKVRRVIRASLGKLDNARYEEVANAVETRLSINVEPIVDREIEGSESFASLPRALAKVLVERLFPGRRMEAGGVSDHAVKIEKDGVIPVARDHVPVASDRVLALGRAHRSHSSYRRSDSGAGKRADRSALSLQALEWSHFRTGKPDSTCPENALSALTLVTAGVRRCPPLSSGPRRKPLPAPTSNR